MQRNSSFVSALPRVVAAVTFLTGLAIDSYAQLPDPFGSSGGDVVVVRGSVQTDEAIGAGLSVELQGVAGSHFGYKSDVSPDGSFLFPGVPSGEYTLRVTNIRNESITTDFISVDQSMVPVTVRLPKNKMERPVSGTVSVARLSHKVPKKARKEFERAVKALKKGDEQKATEHLEAAIQIDPEYVEAHNNLGARYLHAGEAEKALAEFQAALKVDPHAPIPQVNAAAALFSLKRFAESESAARASLDLNPLAPRARYILGLSLMEQQKFTPEALANLQRAAQDVPEARLAAAQLLQIMGQTIQARNQLQAYLNSGKAAQNDEEVKAWLGKLRASQK